MMRKITIFAVLAALLAGGIGAQGADNKAATTANKPEDQKSQPVTEGEFAKWLVNVLGLARGLPPAPSEATCFASLLQNGVTPKAGWNPTNVVTMGTLARVVVQSMRKQAEVKNPEDDNSWIQYLKSNNIELVSVGQALDNLGPIDPAYSARAAVTSTDPLTKRARIRPLDEQQLGTDLQPIRLPDILRVFSEIPGIPKPPPPMTPS